MAWRRTSLMLQRPNPRRICGKERKWARKESNWNLCQNKKKKKGINYHLSASLCEGPRKRCTKKNPMHMSFPPHPLSLLLIWSRRITCKLMMRVCACQVVQSCLTLCNPGVQRLWCVDCDTPGLPIHHQLLELTQTHVHWVSDTIQPSHPLSSPSYPALNLSQYQGLLKWVSSSH